MTPQEIRLRCIEAVVSKSPMGFVPELAIERAAQLVAFVMADTPQGPERDRQTLTLPKTDTASSPRKA